PATRCDSAGYTGRASNASPGRAPARPGSHSTNGASAMMRFHGVLASIVCAVAMGTPLVHTTASSRNVDRATEGRVSTSGVKALASLEIDRDRASQASSIDAVWEPITTVGAPGAT